MVLFHANNKSSNIQDNFYLVLSVCVSVYLFVYIVKLLLSSIVCLCICLSVCLYSETICQAYDYIREQKHVVLTK